MKRFNSDSKGNCPKLQRTDDDDPCPFDKISSNVDVMLQIYKLIDFKDQLHLGMASENLKCIFENFVWKKKYQTLTMIGFASNFVIANESATGLLCLHYSEYQAFIRIYAEGVRTLIAGYDAVPDIRLFRNLNKLEYRFARAFTKEHLRLLAECCPHLEDIRLQYCGNRYLSHINFEEVLDVDLLLQITKLKRLLVIDRYPDKMKYQHFRDIVTRTNLEFFRTNACIEPDATNTNSDTVLALNDLQLEVPFNSSRWPSNYTSFLTNFENLKSLALTINDVASQEILQTIERTCQQLEIMTICSTLFQNIESFPIPPRVTELTLFACEGLSHDNLKQLLTLSSIQKFTSHHTPYHGVFKDFQISPNIELLDLDDVYTQNFPSAIKYGNGLKHLTWYDMRDCTAGSHMLRRIPIEACNKLEALTIKSGFMPLAPLMQLRSLQRIAMSQSMPFLNWRYILILLKHPTLVEIDIDEGSTPHWLMRATHIPDKGFQTNVKNLTISLRVFFGGLTFWFDMFSCNTQMKLTCQKMPMNLKVIGYIVLHERFPRSLRSIDVSGFMLNCKELRNHFAEVITKFQDDTTYMKIMSKSLYRLTLCRDLRYDL